MLAETFQSIQRQSYSNYEVLVLDNASPPAAQEIIRSYLQSEPRARVLRCEERLHMFDNFARGISAAQGQYLTFFHDDDIYMPEFLARHISLLETNARVGFSGSNCLVIDDTGEITGQRELIRQDQVWSCRRYIAALLRLGVNIMPMQSIVFRASVLSPDTFNAAMSASFSDFLVLMRIAEQHEVGLIAAPLLKMREHSDQASRSISAGEAIELRTRILLDYCTEFACRHPDEKSFAQMMEKNVRRTRRIGLLWGWVSSKSESEAEDCLVRLNDNRFETALGALLRQTENWGLSLTRRQQIFLVPLRRIGYAYAMRRDRARERSMD